MLIIILVSSNLLMPTCLFPQYADFVGSFCRDKHLPLMIAESSPFGGIIDEKLARANPELVNDAGYKGSTWNR